jgi:hypothetical protein
VDPRRAPSRDRESAGADREDLPAIETNCHFQLPCTSRVKSARAASP